MACTKDESQRCADLREQVKMMPTVPEPIVLNVGITGHRASVLTAPLLETLRPAVDDIFQQLREAALKIQNAEAAFCSSTPAELRLHTGLASGADQIAASSARSSGYFVRAVLPFEANEYRNDFASGDELNEFERALGDADEVVALPGDRSDSDAAYVLVGQSLIEAADVLVAIWDGAQSRGPGGTAHVVELALQSFVPVIHVDIDRGSNEVRMRALVGGDATMPIRAPLEDADSYCGLLRGAFRLGPSGKNSTTK